MYCGSTVWAISRKIGMDCPAEPPTGSQAPMMASTGAISTAISSNRSQREKRNEVKGCAIKACGRCQMRIVII